MNKQTEQACVAIGMSVDKRVNRRHGEKIVDEFIALTRQSIREEFCGEIAALTAKLEAAEKENARLKTVPMKYRRMTFNAQLQLENAKQAAQIESLEKDAATTNEQRAELMACLQLIYSWTNNWDSEFMNDPEWRDRDFPRIQKAMLGDSHV